MLLDHYAVIADPISSKRFLEARNFARMTALLIAVHQRDWALIDLLIESGADVKAEDELGHTALVHAAKNPSDEDYNPPKELLSPNLIKVINL